MIPYAANKETINKKHRERMSLISVWDAINKKQLEQYAARKLEIKSARRGNPDSNYVTASSTVMFGEKVVSSLRIIMGLLRTSNKFSEST
ncbi:hypothetical protein Leryth_025555 [Lithospermum erythrorhizon]|nr:hypothetical protein Leryth_025555 [Lithospermum erythrorhizon]